MTSASSKGASGKDVSSKGGDTQGEPRPKPVFRIRVPGMRAEKPLGEVVKRLTSTVGVPPCGGCASRAAKLNKVVLAPRRQS
jgi:hypothetical protein